MPFTVSHAAAVLPLRKLNLVSSAFIVGSMAPDFPYIIGNTEYRGMGHQFPGLIEFTIPASLAALWLFHNIIKRPTIGLLPAAMQERLRGQTADFKFAGAARFLAILGSISLGVLSHVVWDSFTHPYTWPWRQFVWLRSFVHVPLVHHRMQVFAALQYLSTIVGMLALAIWVLLWYRRSTPAVTVTLKPPPKSRFGLAVAMFALAAIAGTVRAVLIIGLPATVGRADHFLLVCGVTSLATAFWQILFYCVLMSSYQVWTIP
ncbi:MAG: DUF4184 family protein [Candidatus Korobacteraceae bacterium]|jgi:hypothetical protein